MTNHSSVKKQTTLENILNDIVSQGGYEAALLSDGDGLPIAMNVTSVEIGEMTAAMSAVLRDVARQVRSQLDLANVNELSLVGDDRFRLVCRFFQTDRGQPISLTVIVPPDQSYRRVTNLAIAKIKEAWIK